MEEVVVVLVEVAQKVLLAELHESLVLVGNMLLKKEGYKRVREVFVRT